MICENCHGEQASIHVVRIINGIKQESHLCAKCAAKNNDITPFSMSDIFISAAKSRKCSVCGMTPAFFKQSGKVGCANCYEDLREDLMPLIRRVHGRTAHIGKSPLISDRDKCGLNAEIERLKNELKTAVEAEEYEKAAKLRDEIRSKEETK